MEAEVFVGPPIRVGNIHKYPPFGFLFLAWEFRGRVCEEGTTGATVLGCPFADADTPVLLRPIVSSKGTTLTRVCMGRERAGGVGTARAGGTMGATRAGGTLG